MDKGTSFKGRKEEEEHLQRSQEENEVEEYSVMTGSILTIKNPCNCERQVTVHHLYLESSDVYLCGDVSEHEDPKWEAGSFGDSQHWGDQGSALSRLVGVAAEVELHVHVGEVVPTPVRRVNEEEGED